MSKKIKIGFIVSLTLLFSLVLFFGHNSVVFAEDGDEWEIEITDPADPVPDQCIYQAMPLGGNFICYTLTVFLP